MKLVSTVSKPLSSAVLASLLTALLISPQTKTEIVERVYVRDPAQPRIIREVRIINQNSCPRDVILRAVNEVLRAQGRTGDGSFTNMGASGSRGGNSRDSGQSGAARSGDVVLGQVLTTIAICGRAEVTANNSVTDSEGRSGDAEVSNDADVNASSRPLPFPKPRRTPRPRVSPTPTPTPSSTPVRGSPV